MSFEEIIAKLEMFWRNHGCPVLQPYDMEVGAGTFHPATFLRAIGPEPWNAAYVQPCRRPTDGRYGENPNRLQHYYQFQVVLKPSPENMQALYLASLEAIGINVMQNDIRFLEDNWESPSLGAWGLGWEVWQNGIEISQFTYFQQVGGLPCHPVTGELTYGLERIAMFLQKKESIFDIVWHKSAHKTVKYGSIFLQNEKEVSAYNFEKADTVMLFRHFAEYQEICMQLVQEALPIPAYEAVLKASHCFNVLDARHALSVTERQRYILLLRQLSHAVAKTYLASRKASNFPLLSPEAEL